MDQNQLSNKIKSILEEFKESSIQSEAEVRSKFIVPLSEALGYPSKLRAEEFPIYGFAGCKKLKRKPADFLFFDDKNFADYRENTSKNKEWVEDHSLLIIEAKKPGKMPEDLGQAKFYTMWTKAIAYIETDGVGFKAYFYNAVSKDAQVIDIKIDELYTSEDISLLCYDQLVELKKDARINGALANKIIPNEDGEYISTITNDEDLGLPESTIKYMRDSLGRDAEGLTKVQLTSKFLNFTNSVLQNNMRYNIPSYTYDLPRESYEVDLFINKRNNPLMSGSVTVFYWEDQDRFEFDNDDTTINIVYRDNCLYYFNIWYKGNEKHVSDRILSINKAIELFNADSITLKFKGYEKKNIYIRFKKSNRLKNDLRNSAKNLESSLLLLKMLNSIEKYYDINFEIVDPANELEMKQMIDDINCIYKGINFAQNFTLTISTELFDQLSFNDFPVIFNDVLPKIENCFLHGVEFEPSRLYILPYDTQKIDAEQKDEISVPVCCEYKPLLD